MQSTTAAATSGSRAINTSRAPCTLPVPDVTPSSFIGAGRCSAIACITTSRGLNRSGPSLRAARLRKRFPANAHEPQFQIDSPGSTRRATVSNCFPKAASRDSHALPSDDTLHNEAARTGQCCSEQLEIRSEGLESQSSLQSTLPSQRSSPLRRNAFISLKSAITVACAVLLLPLVAAAAAHAASGIGKVPLTFLQGVRDFLGGNSGTLISPTDQWGVWTVLLAAAAGGFWYGKRRLRFEI